MCTVIDPQVLADYVALVREQRAEEKRLDAERRTPRCLHGVAWNRCATCGTLGKTGGA